MSRRSYVESVFSDLLVEFGLEPQTFDDDNLLSLTIDDVLVTFALQDKPIGQVSIFVDMDEVRADQDEVINALFELNLRSWLSQCMTIGLDPSGKRALGLNVLPADTQTTSNLDEITRVMLAAAIDIREALAQVSESAEAKADYSRSAEQRDLEATFIRI